MERRCAGVGRSIAVLLAAAVVQVAALAGCSVEESTPAPSCPSGGSTLIVAQSVPSASQVPCLESLPDGWSVASVSVNQDRSVITLDSDRAGNGAAIIRLDRTCDIAAAVTGPSEFAGVERFEQIEQLAPGFRASRFYRFAGGCVTWDFEFDQDASAAEAVAVQDVLRLIPRHELSDQLIDAFSREGL